MEPSNYAMYLHGKNTLIKLTHYDKTKKMAHDSQIVRAKENLKMSQGGLATDKYQASSIRLIGALQLSRLTCLIPCYDKTCAGASLYFFHAQLK